MIVAWLTLGALASKPQASDDFRSYLDQARFFLKQEWYGDAREQLELAVETEDGRLDPEAWFLLSKVRYELCDLSGAREAGDRALVNSRDPVQFRQTHDMLQFLKTSFGTVQLVGAHEGMTSRIDISLESTVYDPDLKQYFNNLLLLLDTPVLLPYELGVPAGAYIINGVDVVVEAGGEISLDPGGEAGAARQLQVVEMEFGAGGTAWLGSGATGLLPAPTTEISAGLPLGVIVVGGILGWSPQPFQTRGGDLGFGAAGWYAGVRVGAEVPGTQPLVLRPSLVYRGGMLPGVELACADLGDAWVCGQEQDVRQLYVYTTPVVHSAGLEFAVLYQDRARKSGLGAGVKASGDFGFGRFPAVSEAQFGDRPVLITVDGPGRSWRGVSVRVLGTVSYAF